MEHHFYFPARWFLFILSPSPHFSFLPSLHLHLFLSLNFSLFLLSPSHSPFLHQEKVCFKKNLSITFLPYPSPS